MNAFECLAEGLRRSRLAEFWRRVTDGLSLAELWGQFRREARSGYRLYARELDKHTEREPASRRRSVRARALFWSILLKLSPARRIALLVGIVLLLAGFLGEGHGLDLLGALLVLALLTLELTDRVAMKRDLELAREIQQWLIPSEPPAVPGVEVAFATVPANTVAGDYYDAFLRPLPGVDEANRPLLVVVADVAGKSMPAALLTATFQASLKTLAREDTPLPELVRRLNAYCCEHSLEGRRFTTAFVAELDVAAGQFRYVNAGHNAPVLLRAGGGVERLTEGGLPLGVEPAAVFAEAALPLRSADQVVVFTDGIVEAEGAGAEQYGDARVVACLERVRGAAPRETIRKLMADVDRFVGEAPRLDDVTCLALRYDGKRPG